MAIERTIVGIGEAWVARLPDEERPAGLAAVVGLTAVRLGHRGVAVTRLGQDRVGDRLVARLRELGVDISHIQRDPDLPSRRIEVVDPADPACPDLPRAAFDNLQWDFDLEDVAQVADIVVYGALAQRDGQAGSVVDRLLGECGASWRLFDLTNRGPEGVDRQTARNGLAAATVAVLDAETLGLVVPGAAAPDVAGTLDQLMRQHELQMVCWLQTGAAGVRVGVHRRGATPVDTTWFSRSARMAVILTLVLGAAARRDTPACVEAANRVAAYVTEHPDEVVPEHVGQGDD